MQLQEMTDAFLTRVRGDMAKSFSFSQDPLVEGRWVALEARFDLEGDRRLFGLVSTGVHTHCHERCLFLPVEALTEAGLAELLAFLQRVHDQTVQPDGLHEFTMVSLVLLCGSIAPGVPRMIKKYKLERQYTKPGRGWSSARIAAVELPARQLYCNKSGAALGERLKPTVTGF